MERQPKGSVGIEKKGGYYRLRLPTSVAQGSDRYISTGLKVSKENLKKVQGKAWEIEEQLAKGYYYPDKVRLFDKVTVVPSLGELWEEFKEYKRPQLAETTYSRTYDGWMKRLIAKIPTTTTYSSRLWDNTVFKTEM